MRQACGALLAIKVAPVVNRRINLLFSAESAYQTVQPTRWCGSSRALKTAIGGFGVEWRATRALGHPFYLVPEHGSIWAVLRRCYYEINNLGFARHCGGYARRR
jgi:hypothetical protein